MLRHARAINYVAKMRERLPLRLLSPLIRQRRRRPTLMFFYHDSRRLLY